MIQLAQLHRHPGIYERPTECPSLKNLRYFFGEVCCLTMWVGYGWIFDMFQIYTMYIYIYWIFIEWIEHNLGQCGLRFALLLSVITEPSGLASLSENIGIKYLISIHFCCGKGKFWNYIILSLSTLLHNIFLENHMFQYISRYFFLQGNHKSIAQSRIYCNPWYPWPTAS